MFADIIIITSVWFMSLLMQLVFFPLLTHKTKDLLLDAGWGISRLLTWISLSLIVWFLAHFRLPLNTSWFVYGVFLVGLMLSLRYVWFHKKNIADILQERRAFIITEELLFFFGLYALSLIRAHNPAILDLEKFMDAGFMASYLRSPTLPAPDMWLSGKTINYYSFGHFMGSLLTRLWNMPLSYSYNLLLGFICGMSMMLSFSFVINVLPRKKAPSNRSLPLIIAGLVGALLVVVLGNTHTFWSYLSKGTWQGYWYADATRFIENTIHEFPSYSFVVSDLHGHVWDFPVVLGFLIWYAMWLQTITLPKKTTAWWLLSVGIGVLLGVMTMTSMWDLMIYGLLLVVTGIVLLLYQPALITSLSLSAIVAFVSLAVTVTPFFLHFDSISEGVALVTGRTPLWQLFALWTSHWIMSAAAIGLSGWTIWLFLKGKQKTDNYYLYVGIIAIVVTAWLLILLPELMYVKDIYTGHPRANTMFKLTYQGFILMSLMGAWALGYIWTQRFVSRMVRLIVTLLIGGCVLVVSPFPYFAYRDYYGALAEYKGLNGWAWLEKDYPDDYKAITWMNEHIQGQPVILESWGESYTTFDRVSAYTGLPTVIGWRVHEWLWRGGFDIAGERSGHVDTMFKDPFSVEATNLFNQYQVEYIFVGSKEHEAYPDIDLSVMKQLGQVIYQSGDTFVVKRSLGNASLMQ